MYSVFPRTSQANVSRTTTPCDEGDCPPGLITLPFCSSINLLARVNHLHHSWLSDSKGVVTSVLLRMYYINSSAFLTLY